jgi:hypothetical protein
MGGARPRSGRRTIKIDLAEVEKLCSLQCTDEELASFFGVSVRTIERRRKRPAFGEAMERGKAKGRLSLRRNLFTLAAKGNPAANIFLAKNLLGYRDYLRNEHSDPAGQPIPDPYDWSVLTTEELELLQALLKRASKDPHGPPVKTTRRPSREADREKTRSTPPPDPTVQ